MIIVESPEEVESWRSPPAAVGVCDADHAEHLRRQRDHRALKARFPDISRPPKEDICYATTNRQNAVSGWRRRWMWCW